MSDERPIGLALSGGGYRASLFHLGAMRRLNELGLLEKIGTISSVSGGSILSGFVADRMLREDKTTPQFSDWERSVAKDFREFVGKDIRTWLTLRYFVWNAFQPAHRAKALADAFYKRLTQRMLTDLPSPEVGTEFIFLATDFERGRAWEFERHQIGHYGMSNSRWPSKGITIARAVAASASFPPVFGPVRFEVPEKNAAGQTGDAWLTDGGVYDNLAMEPVWKESDCERVLVSDGGAVMDHVIPKRYGARLLRYSTVAMDQVRSLRQRWFIANIKRAKKEGRDYKGAMWRNASKRKNFFDNADAEGKKRIEAMIEKGWYGYEDTEGGTIDTHISQIRTDLDRFTTAEAKIIENHGYFNADIAIRAFLPEYLSDDAPFTVPHSQDTYINETSVRLHLKGSHSRIRFIARYFED